MVLPDGFVVTPEASNNLSINAFGSQVRTVDEALAKAEIDLNIWEVEKAVINSWPTVIKNATKRPEQIMNWQVKVTLRRRAPRFVQDGIKCLLSDFAKARPKIRAQKRKTTTDSHLLELSLFDAHFGKLCWGEETGQSYDLKIAEKVFTEAVQRLLSRVPDCNFDRIVLPIGNDFFQANNWVSTTAKGTLVDSVDDRMQRVFRVGAAALTKTILLCSERCPVEVLWVPGNHDPETSWYLVEWLSAYFRKDANIKFDAGPSPRKYIEFGCNLIGFTHGNEEKHADLPLIMATEHPRWSALPCREIHVGHFHKKRETSFLSTDEHNGVRVRVLPSLSGTDAWHFRKGYVSNRRAAEAHVWSAAEGHVGYFSSNVV